MPDKKERSDKLPLNNSAVERQTMLCENMSFAAAEAYKLLRTNLMFSFAEEGSCRVIGITSASRSEGKSTTAVNISYSLAQLDRRVLLIDADMRIASVANKLAIPNTPGLSNLLVGMNDVSNTIKAYSAASTGVSFYVMPSGNIPPNPSELLGSERMKVLLDRLREKFDYIVVDLPPVISVSDPLVVSKLADGMLIVVRQDVCQRPMLDDVVKQLQFVDAKILGFVFNFAKESAGGYGRYYKYYGKRDKYSQYYQSGDTQ